MTPYQDTLRDLGLADQVEVLHVLSGYPSPKQINLVLRRDAGLTYVFESSAARPDIVTEVSGALDERGVGALDAVLVTHAHGDHAGGAGLLAGRGRPPGEHAPIFLHSAGYRFLTQPEPAFLQETYELFLTRSQWGLYEYDSLGQEDTIENALRKRFSGYFHQTPKRALRFVDQGQLPQGVVAVETPGHSWDCVLYFDERFEIAIPGDTMICTGTPDRPESQGYVIPIFTVAGQSYSMAFERFLQTVRVLRAFFSGTRVRAVLPPHGRFAITDPLGWVRFAEDYFCGLYRALCEDYFGDAARRAAPFMAKDLNPFIPTAGSHPISTPSHSFGLLCALADEGYLSLSEHHRTRQISFRLVDLPPADYLERRLAESPGPLPILRA